MKRSALLIIAVLVAMASADGEGAKDFTCPLCHSFVDELRHQKDDVTSQHMRRACQDSGAFDSCAFMLPAWNDLSMASGLSSSQLLFAEPSTNTLCQAMKQCPTNEAYLKHVRKDPSPDLRVALSYGSRGYNTVRISLVGTNTTQPSSFWQYDSMFRYFWPEKRLQTTLHNVTPPMSSVNVPGAGVVNISLPAKGKGVRALVIGDPCFSGQWVGCKNGDRFDSFNRITSVLNTALGGDVDMWMLAGDNFYDPHGLLGPQFFGALTLEAKSKPFLSVPGNHDFWQHGSPDAKTGFDTFGNGYMQYYAMDVAASLKYSNGQPLNFSVDPSTVPKPPPSHLDLLPPVENFFSYNMIGNLAVISFSGAHPRNVTDPYLVEACEWVGREHPEWLIVFGHWSEENLGCEPLMDTRDVHNHVTTLPGCKEMSNRTKWIEGHQHCNIMIEKDVGFRLGAFGMGGCENFGFPYVDTTDGFELGYFPVDGGDGLVPGSQEAHSTSSDVNFATLVSCLQKSGLQGCKHLATVWLHQKS